MSCTVAGSAWRRRLVDDVRERLFTPLALRSGPPAAPGGTRYGAEVELLALDDATGAPIPIFGDHAAATPAGRAGSLALLNRAGASLGWQVEPGPHGVPAIRLPEGGEISYEPGGQVEYATPPRATVADLADELERVIPLLVEVAADFGIRLLGQGIDPVNRLEEVRLLLPGDRYRAMHGYLARIGEAGPRMMLQTAAVQVNVELGDRDGSDADLRWRVLHAAAPYLTAVFANSRMYAGDDSGFASFRARQWRLLDRRRTGLLGREADAAEEYTDFALEAGWMLGPEDREPEPFVEAVVRGQATLDDWRRHLTTLFPEVRPRGYLEVRCIDALPPEWCGVPAAVIAGLLADGGTLRRAKEIVGAPDTVLLQDAARQGLRQARLGRGADELFALALDAGERTGVLTGRPLELAWSYYEAYTARGRAPGDEAVGAAA